MELVFSLTPKLLGAVTVLILNLLVSLLLLDIYAWYHLPPGPLPFPFISNLPLLISPHSNSKSWQVFGDLSQTYGPIFTIWMGRSPRIVITDPQIYDGILLLRWPCFISPAKTTSTTAGKYAKEHQ